MIMINPIQGYVFSENKRMIIQWALPVFSLVPACYSFACVRLAIINSENRYSHIMAAAIFGLLCFWLIAGRKKALSDLALQYCCDASGAANFSKQQRSTVDTHLPLFLSRASIASSVKIPWSEQFYLLSNEPFAYVPNHEENGLRTIQSLAKHNVVVLPIKKATTDWLAYISKDMRIPEYPRVAYLQNSSKDAVIGNSATDILRF